MRRRLMLQSSQNSGSQIPEIGFTVGDNSYVRTALEGMTFREFLASDYNNGNWYYGEMISGSETAGYAIIISKSTGVKVRTNPSNPDYFTEYTYYYYIDADIDDVIIDGTNYDELRQDFVTGSGTDCLVRGSKVLLADGTYKNVEDITYDDLLTTYDFTTGKITYNYAGLILHHGYRHRRCMKLCFENNVNLTITSRHHLYDYVKNEFSTIDLERDEFDRPTEGFIGTYYSVEQKQFIPLRLLSFEEFYIDDIAYDIQVSGQEVIMAEGLLSGNDTMNLFPKEGFMLYNKDLCDAFKTAIANKDFETNEYIWFRDNISSEYPFWAWRCDYMWAFHMATENGGLSDEMKESIYQAMRDYISRAFIFVLPHDDNNLILNINNEVIMRVKYGDKITLPNTHSKYYDNSKFLTYNAGDEVEVITSTYIEVLW